MDNIIDYVANITNSLLDTPPLIQLVALFLFSFGEGVPGLGTLLPGGTIAVLAGTLAATGVFSPVIATVVISLGSFLGDIVGYMLGKNFKSIRYIERIINNEKHQRMWDLFDRHIALITIFGKLIPLIRSAPSIIAGARGIMFKKYVVYSMIGSVLWGGVGVFAGNILEKYLGGRAINFIIWILAITLIAFVLKLAYKKIIYIIKVKR